MYIMVLAKIMTIFFSAFLLRINLLISYKKILEPSHANLYTLQAVHGSYFTAHSKGRLGGLFPFRVLNGLIHKGLKSTQVSKKKACFLCK